MLRGFLCTSKGFRAAAPPDLLFFARAKKSRQKKARPRRRACAARRSAAGRGIFRRDSMSPRKTPHSCAAPFGSGPRPSAAP
ncbi:hypothetical protein EYC45_09965 [Pseudoxanthomonas winnipegensis]|nr:hypothetical protein EYC45_09965 [Pseudoxanthomonas winnipegensis]